MNMLANAVAFQLGWFACVPGGANRLPWLGTLVAALLVRLSTRFDGMRVTPMAAGA